jgi:hypothetical protein
MALNFNHIFSGRARRTVETEDQRLIQQPVCVRMPELANGRHSRLGHCARQALSRLMCLAPADPDHADRSWRAAAG